MTEPFVLSPQNLRHRALGLMCKAKLAAKQPWFVSKPLAKAKTPAGEMHNVVAPIRGRTFSYFRNAPRLERAHREAHKDFARLNTAPA